MWAPHTVGCRPRCGVATRAGTRPPLGDHPPVTEVVKAEGKWLWAGKLKKMIENPGTGGFNTGKVNNLSYQSEGFPLTGYFVPVCVGRWAWPGRQNCRRAAAAAVVVVGVNFLNARFNKENLQKSMF